MKDQRTEVERPQSPPIQGTLEESELFAPRRRLSYPRLLVVDDNQTDQGEEIRLRRDSFSIGRADGDLRFPAEALMSSLHARISIQGLGNGQWNWTLEDLDSRYGVFVRLDSFTFSPGMELLIGGSRIRCHGEPSLTPLHTDNALVIVPYVNATGLMARGGLELLPYSINQEPRMLPVQKRAYALGRVDTPGLSDDPFVEPIHIDFQPADGGRWRVNDRRSLNGTWVRISKVTLAGQVSFIAGEQRFIIQIPT